MILKSIAVIATLLWGKAGHALPFDHLDDQVNAAIDTGTFQNPSSNIRPKFRYWLPDASVDVDHLASDIASIASIGAGAIELLNYYLYGGIAVTQDVVPVNWDIFGFGTPAYNTVLIAALKACKANGLLMDFEVGVQSGQGAPAEAGNPGLAWFLVPSMDVLTPKETTFSGTIPGFGTGNLVGVSTAKIISTSTVSGLTTFTVDESSMKDITSDVTADGSLNITFPEISPGGYFIYATYAVQNLVRACVAGPDPQTVIQNGSFAVDHFSAAGAKVTTDFLEQFVLVNGAKELLEEVGNYIWEDSIEVQGPGSLWTPNLTVAFQAQHGYSLIPFLPLIARDNNNALSSPQSSIAVITSGPDTGASYVQDFRDTLNSLYGIYVQAWTNWSNTVLNLQSSAQIGYNMPVDIASNIPFVNAPEGETLAFDNLVDVFRQLSGATNLAGKRVLSVELGANLTFAYSLPLPTLLENAKRAIAGGVNTFVLHGSPYSFSYPNTTWPGYTSFDYEFSDQYTRHQPAWENGFREVLDWLGRTSFVVQAGTPKRDLALWNHATRPIDSLVSLYTPEDLTDAGYAYEYLSPDNLALPQAVVTNGILAANGPAYKVLVIRATDNLTVAGVGKLAEFANAGLPIIAAGGFPPFFSPQNATASAFVNSTLASISRLPNVHITADDSAVASAVQSIGITPRAQVNANGLLWTTWRSTSTSDSVFVFSDGVASVGSIKFASTATPYFFDAWTGEQVAVLNYTVDTSSQTTEIALSLKTDQTVIVAFTNEPVPNVDVPPIHFTSAPDGTLGFSYSKSTGLTAKIPASAITSNTTQVLVTSDGQQHTFKAVSVPAAFELTNWDLTAEHWDPPSNLSDIDIIAVKSNTTHTNLTYPLLDWNSIPGLANTSGLGFYSTSLTWPPKSDFASTSTTSLGAFLTFTSSVLQTLSITINSVALPPIDPTNPSVDITPFLVKGRNEIVAKISTIMYNALVPILEELRTAGSGLGLPRDDYPAFREVGLVGRVEVTPFVAVSVAANKKPRGGDKEST